MESPTTARNSDWLEYFRGIPQCADLLNKPGVRVLRSQPLNSSSARNPLFTETLTLNDGLKKQLFLFRDDPEAQGPTGREGYVLMDLGDGVAGQEGISHGGFLAAVLDHLTGSVTKLAGADGGLGMFTAALNTSYHKPVAVPGVIIGTARVSRIEGRKIFVTASIVDMQGDKCTSAEAIFIQKRPTAL